ncbi:pantetheine-phosphate adenylyltransferase [Brachybacterium huguangmaarense]|uniref:Phosphopantetheine adenylyltransferase n=1 Tax=Brachybacterium huguangmaarense TaxID=1652028 RepID=A0ABY6G0D3_9MICO|nr:pantetheine-phosphate adenylyltransferase [Brachybacterium huguangmaarense]UYG16096.1 pantetheine-phosphate adenylyltransferase [Brachybacterium huguangmaarense]
MSTVVLPGSFDPFTRGHLDLARRAADLAGRVVIAVSHNPSKRNLLDLETRCAVISEVLEAEALADRVQARPLPSGLLVDFCRELGARAVVRGLRSQVDLAYEEPMARMNAHLAEVDTMFLLTDASLAHISSSLVREVAALGGDVDDMLPVASARALRAALADREQDD